MVKYEVYFIDADNKKELIDTVVKYENYDSSDYMNECRLNMSDNCDLFTKGMILVKPVYDEVLILMNDGMTKTGAKHALERGTTIYSSIEDYIQSLKDCDLYENETVEGIRNGDRLPYISAVMYADHEYCIEYVN